MLRSENVAIQCYGFFQIKLSKVNVALVVLEEKIIHFNKNFDVIKYIIKHHGWLLVSTLSHKQCDI